MLCAVKFNVLKSTLRVDNAYTWYSKIYPVSSSCLKRAAAPPQSDDDKTGPEVAVMELLWQMLFKVVAFAWVLSNPAYFLWDTRAAAGVVGASLPPSAFSSGPPRLPREPNRFLDGVYKVKGDSKRSFLVRQVPGDGGCLFHAVTAWITYLQTGQHLDFDWKLRNLSQKLRHVAIGGLRKTNATFEVEHGGTMEASALLQMISDVYEMEPHEYCQQILDPRTWGGGPEIVALSNHFKCPIHVYQLSSSKSYFKPFTKRKFKLEVCGKFGSPTFDTKDPICLLCADGRFPNIAPGEQKEPGDHFLALFPTTAIPTATAGAPASDKVRAGCIATARAAATDGAASSPFRRALRWLRLRRSQHGVPRGNEPSGEKSRVCLLSDCPVASKDSVFREWIQKQKSAVS